MSPIFLMLIVNEEDNRVWVSGDGSMEWDEFTAFCIEAGMAAGSSHEKEDTLFIELQGFDDTTTHPVKVAFAKYIVELDAVVSKTG